MKLDFANNEYSRFNEVIFTKDLFFNKRKFSYQNIEKSFKDIDLFVKIVSSLIKRKKKVHIAVPNYFDKLHRLFLFDEIVVVGGLRRREVSSSLLLYNQDFKEIVARVSGRSAGVKVPLFGSFNIKMSNASNKRSVIKRNKHTAIFITDKFPSSEAEKLYLSGFNVIDTSKSKREEDAKSKSVKINNKNKEKLRSAIKLHEELKAKASEFLSSALSHKRVSDDAKKMIDDIGSKKLTSSLNSKDMHDAIKQCKIDVASNDNLSRDFFSLHDDIKSQIIDIENEIRILKESVNF